MRAVESALWLDAFVQRVKSDAKFQEKMTLWFQKWHEEFDEFSPNHSKIKKFHIDRLFLSKVYDVWAKKIQESSFMTLNSDAEFE